MTIEVTTLADLPPPANPTPRISIVTDSVAQVPRDVAQQLGIHIVHSTITVEGRTYQDGLNLDPDILYKHMRQDKTMLVTTSAPSAGQFYTTFLACLDEGAEIVVYVGLTSRLSGTFSSAQGGAILAQEEFGGRQIVLVDTHLATIAQGFLAIEAARLAAEGASLETILERIRQERGRMGLAAGLETLEYLARGGRIGRAAYMLGSAIHILPVITIDDNGEVSPIGRAHSHRQVLEEILHFVQRKVAAYRGVKLAVMHSDALPRAEQLQAMAIERLHPMEIFITNFTPVMVAHAGPGMIGLAYHGQE